MPNLEEQMRRLKKARENIDQIKEERNRLTGGMDGFKKRKEEIEAECEEKLGVKVEELPEKIETMRTEADTLLDEVEEALKTDED